MSGARAGRSLDRTALGLLAAFAALLLLGPFLPKWAVFLVTVSLAKGLVALGLLLLMRAGLVSFGQGLYYALGAYAGGVAAERYGLGEAVAMLALGMLAAAAVAAVLGILLARYRTIFFAMLSLAFSMILYGLLVKTPALGSTDGFNVAPRTVAVICSTRFFTISAGSLIGRAGTFVEAKRSEPPPIPAQQAGKESLRAEHAAHRAAEHHAGAAHVLERVDSEGPVDLLSQISDIDIDDIRSAVVREIPDVFDDLGACEHFAFAPHQ